MVTNFKKILLLATIMVSIHGVAADGNRWNLFSLRASSESSVETERDIFQDFTNSEDSPTLDTISNKVTLPTDQLADEGPMTTKVNIVTSNHEDRVRLLKKKGKRGKRARGPNPPVQGRGRKTPKKRNRKLNEKSYN